MKKPMKYIAFGLILLVVSLPLIQMGLHPVKEKPLHGAFTLAEKPVFSKENWESGEYQEQVEKYLKDHAGFRNFLVRLYNQVDYSFFRKANAEGATIGKNRQLFEYDYIRSWLAIDNPGESFISKKLNRAKYVQEYLKREKGIDLVIVFEPGKASFYPEHIPEKFRAQKHGPSTYEAYIQKAREIDLDYIDLQAYFMQLKPGSEYPLFPRYGTHWSVFGMKFAADSLLSFIEHRRGIDLARVFNDTTEVSTRPRDTDNDVAKTMNLLFEPAGEKLAYPVLSFDSTSQADKPMVLVVADSYYWNIFNTRIPRYLFANEAFWYFNELVYPDNYISPVHTRDLNLKSEVEKQDVIFLMVTERFIHKFDWIFIDQLYRLYTPEWLYDPVYDNINRIMMHAPWYDELIEKANLKGITLEEELIIEAKYLIYKEDTAEFMIRYGDNYYKNSIAGFPDWMDAIREKARTRGISEQEMLELDALYMFQKRYPVYYELHRGIMAVRNEISEDSAMMNSISQQSLYYHFDIGEMNWAMARQTFRENELRRISDLIRKDEKWLAQVKQKALDRGLTLEDMLRMDAIWVFEQKLK